MGSDYLTVAEAVDGESIELPTETDGTLLLTTLAAQYPGVTGLKFLNEKSGGMRGVRLADGRFHAPENDGWGDHIYYCVINKDTKRKLDGEDEDSPKNKKSNQRCTDLVVLDLPWKATEGEMREYFEGFGDLVLAQVKKDLKTGESKGYGFIRFSSYDSQVRVLAQRHMILGRWCDVKIPKSNKEPQQSNASPKVYVGRLTEDITADDLREYFSSFGEVTHVFITSKPFRGFAFVTFLHADVAQSLYGENHVIKNTSVIVSNPKSESRRDSSRRDDYDDDEDSYSRDQPSFGSRGGGQGRRGGGGYNDGQGIADIPPQLTNTIVSAVLSQLTGGMQDQGQSHQGQMHNQQQQQQQYDGGRGSSPQNNWETSSPKLEFSRRPVIRDSQFSGGMQGRGQGHMQQQEQPQQQQQHYGGGGRNSSSENIWETSYPGFGGRPVKRDSQGRMRGGGGGGDWDY